ncbi:MAG: imelysin family protein [Myxococcota bacterium]
MLRLIKLVPAPLLIVSLVSGCTAAEPSQTEVSFDRTGMLANLADAVVLPTLRRFDELTVGLVTSCAQWEVSPESDDSRAAARLAFAQTADLWQEAELFQIGPAGVMGQVMGGEDLRDELYSWPLTNACAIDQLIMGDAFSAPGFFTGKLVNVRGLDALEYVLFIESDDNACPGPSAINAEGKWNTLTPAEIRRRRATYSAAVARDLRERARELLASWETQTGDFRGAFANAGEDDRVYQRAGEAIDAVYAALFYLELVTKDRKLAVPAGLHIDCVAESCPDLIESRYAKQSLSFIAANLRGFERLFFGRSFPDGAEGLGLDDYLVAANAAEVASAIETNLRAVQQAISSFDGDLDEVLRSDVQRVRELHTLMRALTDDLKTQVPSVLGLRVPQEGAGDND